MADSDYTPDETLLDVTARFYLKAKYGDDPNQWPPNPNYRECVEAARTFLTGHRLVSLPMEPRVWEAEIARDGWYTYGPNENRIDAERLAADFRVAADFRATGRIRPVYTIHGEPIDLTRPTDTGTDTR